MKTTAQRKAEKRIASLRAEIEQVIAEYKADREVMMLGVAELMIVELQKQIDLEKAKL